VPQRRLEGFEQALAEGGIAADRDLHEPGYFTIEGGYDAAQALLDHAHPPTAIFAFSDEMAMGTLWAARDRGVDVPGQLSIIGVDDHDVSPVVGLTTVHQDVGEHGARAARAMIKLLSGVEVPAVKHNAPIRLVGRRTTAPPA
jgi:DNA-binding LacI/PurR family transcriptional regulator